MKQNDGQMKQNLMGRCPIDKVHTTRTQVGCICIFLLFVFACVFVFVFNKYTHIDRLYAEKRKELKGSRRWVALSTKRKHCKYNERVNTNTYQRGDFSVFLCICLFCENVSTSVKR